MKVNLIVILGPTASGKTALAARLAREIGAEIISADSRQVYRGMNLGTGKDLDDYTVDGFPVPFHLIDIVSPEEDFSVFEYQQRFYRCFAELSGRGILPVMVGGTGLYLESVIRAYGMCEVPENAELRQELAGREMEDLRDRFLSSRPAAHNTSDLTDRARLVRAIEIAAYTDSHPPPESRHRIIPLVIGIRWDRQVLRRRITERLNRRLSAGMIDEVRALRDSGLTWERLFYFGLEYRYIGLYLQGVMGYAEMCRTLNTKIHQFAKRQETWFRRMERQGIVIHWVEGGDHAEIRRVVQSFAE
jgi:tRNA dimethylallyltransferase